MNLNIDTATTSTTATTATTVTTSTTMDQSEIHIQLANLTHQIQNINTKIYCMQLIIWYFACMVVGTFLALFAPIKSVENPS